LQNFHGINISALFENIETKTCIQILKGLNKRSNPMAVKTVNSVNDSSFIESGKEIEMSKSC
jgi:hypothetical protein